MADAAFGVSLLTPKPSRAVPRRTTPRLRSFKISDQIRSGGPVEFRTVVRVTATRLPLRERPNRVETTRWDSRD